MNNLFEKGRMIYEAEEEKSKNPKRVIEYLKM
jgi:hypothetical protein